MPENRLEILLSLDDQATAPLKRSVAEARGELNRVGVAGQQAGNDIDAGAKKAQNGFEQATKQVRQFRGNMLLVTVAVAAASKAIGDYADRNKEAKSNLDAFKNSMTDLSATFGLVASVVLPGLTEAVNFMNDAISGALTTLAGLGTFVAQLFAQIKEHPLQIGEAFREAQEAAQGAMDFMAQNLANNRVQDEIDEQQKKIVDLEKIQIKATKTMKQGWDATKDAIGDLGSALAGAAVLGKGFAKAAAAISLGMAIVNTAEGVTRALKDYPWPFSAVVAGIVAATGAIQVATIAATNFASGTDTVPANLSPGEMVFPRSMAQAIRSGDITVGGRDSGVGGSNITIIIERADMSSNQAIDQVAEQLGFGVERSLRLGRSI